MATNFQVTLQIVYENGTLKEQYAPGTISLPQATKGVHTQTITHTTAEADVSVSTLGTPGYCVLQNLESSTTGKTLNYGWKSSTGGIPQYSKLPPKGVALLCYGTSAMVLRAKAASGTLQSVIKTYEA